MYVKVAKLALQFYEKMFVKSDVQVIRVKFFFTDG